MSSKLLGVDQLAAHQPGRRSGDEYSLSFFAEDSSCERDIPTVKWVGLFKSLVYMDLALFSVAELFVPILAYANCSLARS